MKILGFEITRIKKEEYKDAEKFKNLVMTLMESVSDIKNTLTHIHHHIGEMDYVAMLSNQLVFMDKQCHMYGDSKFASPSSYMTMICNLNQVPSTITCVTELMCRARGMNDTLKIKSKELDIPFDKLFRSEEILPLVQEIRDMLKSEIEKLMIITINISTCLSTDCVKILNGVDLVKEFKQQSKIKNDKDTKSFNISFKFMPKDKVLSNEDEFKTNEHS